MDKSKTGNRVWMAITAVGRESMIKLVKCQQGCQTNGKKRFVIFALCAVVVAAFALVKCDSSAGPNTNNRGVFTDSRDNQTYRWVRIGTQVWMAENLNFNAPGSLCYDDEARNCNIYGRLYDWSTAMGLPSSCNSSSCANQVQSRHRGICPAGWHVPSDGEWEVLVDFVGSNPGTKLKSATGWVDDGWGFIPGTDDFGFSALPGGYRHPIGSFYGVGSFGIWRSATENEATSAENEATSAENEATGAWVRYMYSEHSGVSRDWSSEAFLYALRCLED